MKRTLLFLALLALPLGFVRLNAADSLERDFQKPPDESRPWVYWFWLNGNITKEGITADLEAMKEAGIRGVLIMEVDQGTPVGPADFMGTQWRELFQHVHKEARRLGLEVNMNNDAGWNGSGGPWIKPEQAMQKIVWTETDMSGPKHFDATLARPEAVKDFYRDISVMAFPKIGAYRIPNIRSKALFEMGATGPGPATNLAPENVLSRTQIRLLKGKMDENGRLVWDVPDGDWTVLRFGCTATGVENAPAPKTGRGLECDKLSKKGIAANFDGMMEKLVSDNKVKPKGGKFGLNATHIDSWENGSQNWTATMRGDFWERRGYDLEEFLPVVTGRVVDSLETSERFLWDLRQTISELVINEYAGGMRDLAHSKGLRFTVEAYGSPCDHLPYAGRADEPMGEFWTPSGSAIETCRGMASAGHVYGKNIIGAEAFTADDHERWLEHPALLKTLGDRAFCEGINRFVFHRYAMQPWVGPGRAPGVMMGPWGQHYERTQTWWREAAAWHEYLARCQHLLRQGEFVADICYLQSEAPPQGFGNHPRAGYGWDECPPELVLRGMTVREGRMVLPGGMSYRVLVLPHTDTMTPELLRAVMELARAGAVVIGSPPDHSPSLKRYPQCDQEVKSIVAEFWADCDGVKLKKRRVGQGWIIRGMEPEEFLKEAAVSPDFVGDRQLNYIHRATATEDIYFVANSSRAPLQTSAAFRVSGKQPELWFPEDGRLTDASVWYETNGVTTVGLEFSPAGSVFVVFRKPHAGDPVVSVTRNGKPLITATAPSLLPVKILSATYGIPGEPQRTRDVRARVQSLVDSGRLSFQARSVAEGDDPAFGLVKTLTITYSMGDRQFTVSAKDSVTVQITPNPVHATVVKARYGVLSDPARTRDVRDKLQALLDSGESSFKVARMAEGDDPAFMVVKTLEVDYTVDGKSYHLTGTDPQDIDFAPVEFGPETLARVEWWPGGAPTLVARTNGDYQIRTSGGREFKCSIASLPAPLQINGPWHVSFPGSVTAEFEKLASWSEHPDSKVRYFSGTAVYRTRFNVPKALTEKTRRLYLDLGDVQVMARVKVNGRDLGLLWKQPFEVDVTKACKTGENRLEVAVVNLWPNRLIGDEQLPEDSERNNDGTLKHWPQWLLDGKPSPTGRSTFVSWRLWKKQDSLLRSGLLGPVEVRCAEVWPVGRGR